MIVNIRQQTREQMNERNVYQQEEEGEVIRPNGL